jgi:hypothetical protein
LYVKESKYMGVPPKLPSTPPTPELEAAIESAVLWEHEALPSRAKTRRRQSGEFIARLPYGPTILAAQLPGKALAVWLLVHHLARLSRFAEVTLPASRLTDWGIKQMAFLRALRHLEKAGLILIHKQGAGRSTVIELIELPADGEEDEG